MARRRSPGRSARLALSGALNGHVQRNSTRRHLHNSGGLAAVQAGGEVLTDREQRVRLKLAERSSELLLKPVEDVKEAALLDVESAAAHFPVGTEQQMEPEYLMFLFAEGSLHDEQEISDEFLIPTAPRASGIPGSTTLERCACRREVVRNTFSESLVASAKNRSKHTRAWCFFKTLPKPAES